MAEKLTIPVFDPATYFNGTLRAYGVFVDRFGSVRRQFYVAVEGRRMDQGFQLDEAFVYDDGETEIPVTVYVDEIKVVKSKDHKTDIVLDDKMTLRMKYPSINQFIETNFDVNEDPKENVNKTFKIISECIDTIYTQEDAWDAKDYTSKERVEFIEQLNSKQYKEVEKFFATMPKLSHKIEVTNPNTKKKSSVVLEGLADFFG